MNLKLLLLISITSFSSLTFGQDIQVSYGFNHYSLNMTKEEITFKKKEFSATVKKEACSTKLFNDFIERFSVLTKEKPKNQTSGAEFLVKYKVDKKEGTLTPSHSYAQKLLSIPDSFDVFKLATEFRCQEGKK